MATKPLAFTKSINDQASHRYPDTFTDQHKSRRFPEGRPWWGWREWAAMKGELDGFVGSDLMRGSHEDPSQSWTAPWIPERQFFDFNYRKSAIVINYRRMLTHDAHYWNAYYDAANKIAYEKSWDEVTEGSLPRPGIRAVIGEPPRSPRVAQAALAGDRWLLGDEDEKNVNEELARLLGLSKHGIRFQREPIIGVTTPEAVLQLTASELRLMIQEEAAKLVAAAQPPKRKHRRTKPVDTGHARPLPETPTDTPTETAA